MPVEARNPTVSIRVQGRVATRAVHAVAKRAALTTLATLPTKAWSRCRHLLHSEPVLAIQFVTPAKMRVLNRTFRAKDRPTDVLSFSQIDPPPRFSPEPEMGDVIVCLAIARKQAKEFNCSLHEEVARLTVHGVLHLFGYDHEVGAAEARRMFRLQDKIMLLLANRFDRVQTCRPRRRVKRP